MVIVDLASGKATRIERVKRFQMAEVVYTVSNAGVYLFSEQSFAEFPDLVTTDGSFKELRKVSTPIRRRPRSTWGTSEVVQFKNADGVRSRRRSTSRRTSTRRRSTR